ncbi:MAG: formate dehydrogenase subunit alpha [Halobellus sp.]
MSDAEHAVEPRESVCPFCGVGCSLSYVAQSGKSTGVEGPINTKGEICPKGAAAFDVVEHDDRLTEPLLRDGDGFAPVSWEGALGRIEDRLGTIVSAHGPDAVGFFASSNCTNEENYVLQKLARVLGTNNVDNCARLCHSSTVAAMQDRFGAGAMTNSLSDLGEADAFLVTGANPAEQHPVAFRSYLLPAVRDGATLIHIDPRANDTTDAADVHLPVRPGHDIPLLNAMAAVIVEEGLVDEGFVDRRTTGVEDLRTFLDEVDVAENADLAGVDESDLREAARAYGEADRAAAFTGMGISQHRCGTQNVHALVNLALLTGNVGRRGTGVNPLRGQNNVQGASDVGTLPSVLPGYRDVTDPEDRQAIADEWGVEPPAEPGLTEVEMTHAFGDEIRGAVVLGENPALTEPDGNSVGAKFEELDFLVVIDLFETETAQYADVVLPGSAWAEKSGTVTNTDRQVLRMRPMTDPPGEARRDLNIVTALGERLTDRSFRTAPEAVFDELTRVSPIHGGMSYAGVEEGGQRWPFPAGADSGTQILHRDRFASGERTAPLVPVEHVPPAEDTADDELTLTTGRIITHFNSGALTRRSETLSRMADEDALRIHPDAAAERGIDDGDEVRVASERGEVTVPADVTPAVRPGTVFLTFHFEDAPVNRITGDALDPTAKIPEYKHTPVSVEPA